MNQIPTVDQLSHVSEAINFGSNRGIGPISLLSPHNPCTLSRTVSVSSIPKKLLYHIQDGCFINMAKLLPNNFEALNLIDDDQTTVTKHKQQDVTQIMDWIHCFSTYIAAVIFTKPSRVADLVIYLNVIINSQRQFQDFDWVLYDHQF